MIKTTVYFDESVALSLRQLARAEGRARADIIRDAVAQYIAQTSRPQSTGIGAYHSGRSDVADHAEELFGELVRKRRCPPLAFSHSATGCQLRGVRFV